ncbi:hypothetical protein [Sphingomonas mollis]|uniref:Uncharacterized protein n=1 Tax=Sphingomonas mollis TaxID=2795726 RepID=A0ABS0XPU4_9SPHN|nr:hypothetical protein [Sphingomonas sp. BT553]MBJ6122065.1 hypothetical protein [Sphingomonas sp. BT553]
MAISGAVVVPLSTASKDAASVCDGGTISGCALGAAAATGFPAAVVAILIGATTISAGSGTAPDDHLFTGLWSALSDRSSTDGIGPSRSPVMTGLPEGPDGIAAGTVAGEGIASGSTLIATSLSGAISSASARLELPFALAARAGASAVSFGATGAGSAGEAVTVSNVGATVDPVSRSVATTGRSTLPTDAGGRGASLPSVVGVAVVVSAFAGVDAGGSNVAISGNSASTTGAVRAGMRALSVSLAIGMEGSCITGTGRPAGSRDGGAAMSDPSVTTVGGNGAALIGMFTIMNGTVVIDDGRSITGMRRSVFSVAGGTSVSDRSVTTVGNGADLIDVPTIVNGTVVIDDCGSITGMPWPAGLIVDGAAASDASFMRTAGDGTDVAGIISTVGGDSAIGWPVDGIVPPGVTGTLVPDQDSADGRVDA